MKIVPYFNPKTIQQCYENTIINHKLSCAIFFVMGTLLSSLYSAAFSQGRIMITKCLIWLTPFIGTIPFALPCISLLLWACLFITMLFLAMSVLKNIDKYLYQPLRFAFMSPEAVKKWEKRHSQSILLMVPKHFTQIIACLIDKGANLNSPDKYGNTPLHLAARNGRMDIAQILIEKGAELNAPDKHGNTPLHVTVFNRQMDIAQILIEKGAELNAPDKHGNTPLHVAALTGHMDIAKLLIENKAEIDATTIYRDTPLHLAALTGHMDIATLLIEKGAKIDPTNSDGNTPRHLAEIRGYIDMAKLLV